jgi:hypothetical protein
MPHINPDAAGVSVVYGMVIAKGLLWIEIKLRDELLHMMKKVIKDRYVQTAGFEIEESGGIGNSDRALIRRQSAQAGKPRSTGYGAEDEWAEIRHSTDHQLLNQFSGFKGAQIPESDVEAELKLLMKATTLLKSICKLTLTKKAT